MLCMSLLRLHSSQLAGTEVEDAVNEGVIVYEHNEAFLQTQEKNNL
jgi:hypothetical protein